MATRTITTHVSDLSGDEIEDGHSAAVDFSYRGTNYTIDLTAEEAAAFDGAIAEYLDHATRVSTGRRRSSAASKSSTGGSDAAAVREWAQAHNIDVPARGRIPTAVREQYKADRN